MLILASFSLLATLATSDASAGPRAPGTYVLALGDSVSFGYQSYLFDPTYGVDLSNTDAFVGYPDYFMDRLVDTSPGKKSELVNLSCPGESSDSMVSGYCSYNVDAGLPLHDGYSGAQLDAAEAFLLDNPGKVSPIFVSIGANDGNALIAACGGLDLACIGAGAPGMLANLAVNVDETLDRLTAAAPSAQIILLEYYNPYYVADPATDGIALAINDTVASVASAYSKVDTVDGYTAINGGGVATVCGYTNFCTPYVDIHPNDAGHELLSDLFWDASGFSKFE